MNIEGRDEQINKDVDESLIFTYLKSCVERNQELKRESKRQLTRDLGYVETQNLENLLYWKVISV